MADLVPIAFPLPSESAIASYSYTDVAENTGVLTFYGYRESISGSTTYGMNTTAPYSYLVETAGSADGTAVKAIDVDFDSPEFNLPKVIRGTARFQVPATLLAGSNTQWWVTAALMKYDGTTETIIASGSSLTRGSNGAGVSGSVFIMPADCTETNIAAGDKLRVNVRMMATSTGAAGCYILHSPQNNDGTTITVSQTAANNTVPTSQMIFYIPTKLDL